ncbi:hypothetical protein [Prosthecobacter dejongeii]|uniref:Uncharacterized protein n=1 Tax=Prosthecobacter dejongeii TaxID=48465 RepID=A0A7W8DP05_9BACT|nr:hypothetical protein [Prosthecobacter dejongeii]MBB5037129.1 hypothetical protein [Prosthecobacter dejongeii]
MTHEIRAIQDSLENALDHQAEILTAGLSARDKAAILQGVCAHLGEQIETLLDAD